MTPLHEAVLFGQAEDVQRWAKQSDKNQRNALGHTPIHLAIFDPHYLPVLLDAGHDPDAVDEHGFTPLMYAAAYNRVDTASILLGASADPFILSEFFDFTFVTCAVLLGHWDLILDLICLFDGEATHLMAERLAHHVASTCLNRYVRVFRLFACSEIPSKFTSKCKSLKVCLDNLSNTEGEVQGRTLLHYAQSAEEVDSLPDHCLENIDRVDKKGQTALMNAIANRSNSSAIERLINAGASINLQDKRGHSSCHIVMQNVNDITSGLINHLDYLCVLVTHGVDVLMPDKCRCSCSTSGCLPTPDMGSFERSTESSAVFLMEWIILILETCGIATAKRSLLASIRRAEHKRLGMPHTCCKRGGSISSARVVMPDEDIDEILEEEAEFITLLDETMKHESERGFNSLLRRAIFDTKPPMDQTGHRLWSTDAYCSGVSSHLACPGKYSFLFSVRITWTVRMIVSSSTALQKKSAHSPGILLCMSCGLKGDPAGPKVLVRLPGIHGEMATSEGSPGCNISATACKLAPRNCSKRYEAGMLVSGVYGTRRNILIKISSTSASHGKNGRPKGRRWGLIRLLGSLTGPWRR